MASISTYMLLKAIHIVSFAIWSSIALGGYIIIRYAINKKYSRDSSALDTDALHCSILSGYLSIAYIQAGSFMVILATGFTMASMISWPGWSVHASYLAVIITLLETLHIAIARRARTRCSVDIIARWYGALSIGYIPFYILILYYMVFKP